MAEEGKKYLCAKRVNVFKRLQDPPSIKVHCNNQFSRSDIHFDNPSY